MSEIKPCPFCGSLDIQISPCTGMCMCRKCRCRGPLIGIVLPDWQNYPEKEQPVRAWNTRGESNEKNM